MREPLSVLGENLALKLVVTPLLIAGASLAGRRFGHHVGGWLVGLPLTSGPVAFFLVADQGAAFATGAAVGMLAGTSSQVAFALAYRALAGRGAARGWVAGCAAFAVCTAALSLLHWSAAATFALVLATLVAGRAVATRRPPGPAPAPVAPPRWDIPVRMTAATGVVVLMTTLAPVLGAQLAGLLAPFPVFGAVLAVATHRSHGPAGAIQVLDGLLLGLLAAAVFFLVLALALPGAGYLAFAAATGAAVATHAAAVLAIPRGPAALP